MSWSKADPVTVEVQGRPLRCRICEGGAFHKREAQLNTATATMFGLDWLNKSAVCYVCARCGHIDWFLPQ